MAVTTQLELQRIIDRRLSGGRLTFDETMALLKSPDLMTIGRAADEVRRQLHPDNKVSFIIDRNINYTNVCVAQCSFCAFKRDVGHEEGYTLSQEVIDQKLDELVAIGGTQVLLQGGLNPALKLGYYQEMISHIQTKYPQVTVHGFSPSELFYLAKISRLPVLDCLRELQKAGLRSTPGAGGEIFDDAVRKEIGKGKVLSDQWFEVMEAAQQLGMNTTATVMYGHIETMEQRALTLQKLRDSGDKHGGYRAFIAWDFQPDNTPLGEYMTAHADQFHLGTGWEYLHFMAVARLVLDNVPNMQVSWVTQGPQIGQLGLHFGANDFGGTMMEENVVSAAGTTYRVGPEETIDFIKAAGFTPYQRDTFYNELKVY